MRLSKFQAGRLLKRIGLSALRFLYRVYQRHTERVEEWKKIVYPKIRQPAATENQGDDDTYFQIE
jgi:hypothetical protein